MNLNEYEIYDDTNKEDYKLRNYNKENKEISVYFKNIDLHLINKIREADGVFGCIAWLTHARIIDALSAKPFVSIIVQKEDFLRPDISSGKDWKSVLRSRYDKLKNELCRYDFPGLLRKMSWCSCDLPPIRCVGYSSKKDILIPRMHNKFLIFSKIKKGRGDSEYGYKIKPYAIWTGSFNLTQNATRSLENAIYITDSSIVEAYFNEYQQIAAMSEPLNWDDEYISPEWRIGT